MADVVYLHVGAPKTGTTYVQDRLHRNRRTLAAAGVRYPVGTSKDMFLPALDLLDMPFDGVAPQPGNWDGLVRRVKRSSGRVIVSHELLSGASPEQAERALRQLAGPELHLVYSTRDLARQIPAVWQESLKHRRRTKFKTFVRQVRTADRHDPTVLFWRFQSLPDVLSRWGRELPPDRVHVVTVPPPGGEHDELWRRYCAAFAIDPAWAPLPSVEHNASMGIEEAALTRALNTRLRRAGLDSDSYRRIVRERLVQETLARRPGKRTVLLPPKAYGWVEAVTEEWLAYLAESQVDVVGDVGDLRPRWPSGDTPWRDPDRPRPSHVADAALDALAAVVLDAAGRPDPQESTTARLGRAARRLRGD